MALAIIFARKRKGREKGANRPTRREEECTKDEDDYFLFPPEGNRIKDLILGSWQNG